MNVSYPQTNADFDVEYVFHLAVAVFQILEIEGFLEEDNLKCFNVQRLKFIKSKSMSI